MPLPAGGGYFIVVTGTPATMTFTSGSANSSVPNDMTNQFAPSDIYIVRSGGNLGYYNVTSSSFDGTKTNIVSSSLSSSSLPGPIPFVASSPSPVVAVTNNAPPTVATPTFSPAAGTYSSSQSVVISSATSGSTIYYTTDGSTPTTSSAVYSTAITVSASETLKALATKAGDTNSTVASAAYVISAPSGLFSFTAATDASSELNGAAFADGTTGGISGTEAGFGSFNVASPMLGGYEVGQFSVYYGYYLFIGLFNVTTRPTGVFQLIDDTGNVVSYDFANANQYTTGSGTGTGHPITSGQPFSITYYYWYPGPALTVGNTYTVNAGVSAPTFSPASGSQFATTETVTMTAPVGTIYYTLDGTTPTTASTLYTGPITLGATTTVNAIANNGSASSSVGTATYTNFITAPTFSPSDGSTFATTETVTISSQSGTSIYYTLDGSTPTTASSLYSTPLSLSATTTVKAISHYGSNSSSVATATYTNTITAPVISPAGGLFTGTETVSITSQSGTSIYYTLDGSTPTTSSTLYSAPISLSATTTVKAISHYGSNTSTATSDTFTVYVPSAFTFTAAQYETVANGAGYQDITAYTLDTGNFGSFSSGAALSGYYVGEFYVDSSGLEVGLWNVTSAPTGIFQVTDSAGTLNTFDFANGRGGGSGSGTGTGNTIPSGNSFTYNVYTIPYTPASGPIVGTYVPSGGSGYTNGTYNNVSFTGGSGTGATANITVSGNAVQYNTLNDSMYMLAAGTGYKSGDVLTIPAASIGGTGSGFSMTVESVGGFIVGTTYTVYPRLPAPTFSPASGIYSSAQSVSITASSGTTIYYTLDGSTPTTSSTVYSTPISVSSTETIKAIAISSTLSSVVGTSGYYFGSPPTNTFWVTNGGETTNSAAYPYEGQWESGGSGYSTNQIVSAGDTDMFAVGSVAANPPTWNGNTIASMGAVVGYGWGTNTPMVMIVMATGQSMPGGNQSGSGIYVPQNNFTQVVITGPDGTQVTLTSASAQYNVQGTSGGGWPGTQWAWPVSNASELFYPGGVTQVVMS